MLHISVSVYLHRLRAVLVLAWRSSSLPINSPRDDLNSTSPLQQTLLSVSYIDKQPTMDPTIGEVRDKANADASKGGTNTETGQLSWSKVSIWLQGRPRGFGVTVNGCTE